MTQLTEEQPQQIVETLAGERIRMKCGAADLRSVITDALSLLDSDSQAGEASPIDMILFCPRCGTQHVDAPEDETTFRHRVEAWIGERANYLLLDDYLPWND